MRNLSTSELFNSNVTSTYLYESNNSGSITPPSNVKSLESTIILSLVLSMIDVATIIGNSFVIAAIRLDKNLKSTANILIMSLASTDLLVAVLVLPISIVNEVSDTWFLGPVMCDIWIALDVLCCTASILHLVAIAFDRYWAVTSVRYMKNRSRRRIIIMIIICWISSLVISLPPLFGLKDPSNNPDVTGVCLISQDIGYTLFSTILAFYIPAIVMMVIYAKIYRVVKATIVKDNLRRRPGSAEILDEDINVSWRRARPKTFSESPSSPTAQVPYLHAGNILSWNQSGINRSKNISMITRPVTVCIFDPFTNLNRSSFEDILNANKKKDKLNALRERKATRTLGIITGAFITCWLPFFIVALSAPLARDKVTFHPVIVSLVLWLGYCNSMINPVLYTIFSPDFKTAFRRILIGRYWRKIYRH